MTDPFFVPTELDDTMHPFRIPGANVPHFARHFNGSFWVRFSRMNDWSKAFLEANDEHLLGFQLSRLLNEVLNRHLWLYARGEELGALADRMGVELSQLKILLERRLSAKTRLGLPAAVKGDVA